MNDRTDRILDELIERNEALRPAPEQRDIDRLRAALAEGAAALKALEAPKPVLTTRRSQRDDDESTMRAVFRDWVGMLMDAKWSKRSIADGLNDIDIHFFQDLLDGKRRLPSWIWPAMARLAPAAFNRAMSRIQPAELSRAV